MTLVHSHPEQFGNAEHPGQLEHVALGLAGAVVRCDFNPSERDGRKEIDNEPAYAVAPGLTSESRSLMHVAQSNAKAPADCEVMCVSGPLT